MVVRSWLMAHGGQAVAVLQGDFGAGGTVVLTQANLGAPVNVTGRLTGLDARALRGFHIQCVSICVHHQA